MENNNQLCKEYEHQRLSGVCPHCGYCPHCGRANDRQIVPYYPYPTHPWYPNPYTYTGIGTIDMSGYDNIELEITDYASS